MYHNNDGNFDSDDLEISYEECLLDSRVISLTAMALLHVILLESVCYSLFCTAYITFSQEESCVLLRISMLLLLVTVLQILATLLGKNKGVFSENILKMVNVHGKSYQQKPWDSAFKISNTYRP